MSRWTVAIIIRPRFFVNAETRKSFCPYCRNNSFRQATRIRQCADLSTHPGRPTTPRRSPRVISLWLCRNIFATTRIPEHHVTRGEQARNHDAPSLRAAGPDPSAPDRWSRGRVGEHVAMWSGVDAVVSPTGGRRPTRRVWKAQGTRKAPVGSVSAVHRGLPQGGR